MPAVTIQEYGSPTRTWSLVGDIVSFGALPDNTLVLTSKGVSRRHGRLVRDESGRWAVEDLESKNGIRVNGQAIRHWMLAAGDVIAVGEAVLTYRDDSADTGLLSSLGVVISEQATGTTFERPAGSFATMDNRRLTALYGISKRLMDQHDVAGLIDVASASLIDALGAEVVVFGLTCDPVHEGERIIVRPLEAQQSGVTLSRSVLQRTLEARQAILVADTHRDQSLVMAQSIVEAGICSALCVPMLRNETATGFIYVDSRRHGRSYTEGDLEFACAVGSMVAIAVENTRLHEAELVKERLERELAAARRIQEAILPSQWPKVPGWDIYGAHSSCREVGGDYYDAIPAPDGRVWLIIADVCGKGAGAALVASSMHAGIYALVDQCSSPGQLLTRLNRLLLRRELRSFVTCLAALLTPGTGEVTISSAGHPHPLQVSPRFGARLMKLESGFMLGLFPDAEYHDTKFVLADLGSAMLLYTDGVIETLNDTDDEFGEARLLKALSSQPAPSPQGIVEGILHELAVFRSQQAQSDDVALLAVQRAIVP